MQPYHNYLDSAAPSGATHDPRAREAVIKAAQLEAENTALRNQLLGANDEIFLLQANAAVAQVEATVSLEAEIAKLKSELNFRVRKTREVYI